MLFIRSLIFNIAFYLSNAAQLIFWLPVFFFVPRDEGWKIAKLWALSHLWLHHLICGTRFEFRGIENIPKNQSLLVAAKHQSAWETYTMLLFFDDPAYILKRSLMYVPLFGWFMAKMKVVPIDRGKGSLALQSITDNARKHLSQAKRQVIIFPEGTRTIVGAKPKYKYGITHLYRELGISVQPVALNSGLYWGKRGFYLYPGIIRVEFLTPIKPGFKRDAFSKKLEQTIETACEKLYRLAAEDDVSPPRAIAFKKSNKSAVPNKRK